MGTSRALGYSSLFIAVAASAQVPWQVETAPQGVSAGPVAIARSGADGGAARIVAGSTLGTNLSVFALDGGLTQNVSTGIVHGVAAITGLPSPTAPRDLVVATGFVNAQLYVMGVGADGQLSNAVMGNLNTTVAPGVLALSLAPDGGLEAIFETGTGKLSRVTLSDDGQGRYVASNASDVNLPNAPTAMVADDQSRRLFAAIPQLGIVQVLLDDPTVPAAVIEPLDGGALGGLPSGLALYRLSQGHVLLVSVPLTNEIIAYDVGQSSLTAVARFSVSLDGGTGPGSGAVTGCQRLAVTTDAVDGFPRGLLALQDPNAPGGANYKLAGLAEAAAAVPALPLPPVTPPPDAGLPDGGVGRDGGQVSGSTGIPMGDPGGDVAPPRPCGCGLPSPLLPAAVVVISALLARRRRSRNEP